jgi:hypothetical protein
MYKGYLSIVPKTNLICNIGVGVSSTHANVNISSNWQKGMLHFIPTENIEIPLNHPNFIMCDTEYDDTVDKTWGFPNPIIKQIGRARRLIKRILKRS